jgi:hypothetical protein
MTKLEVSIDINPSKEAKGKAECKASVITFGAHLNEDKNELDVQIEEKIIFSIKKVIVSLLKDVESEI